MHYDADDPAVFESGWPTRSTHWSPTRSGPTSYGGAGRQRCIDEFSWAHIAEQTLEIYRKVSA